MAKRVSLVRLRYGRAVASDWIVHFESLKTVVAVVLYLRVSSHKQLHRKNLDDQEAFLRSYLESHGVEVVEVVRVVASGWDDDWFELDEACRIAKEHGAVVLAESTDRYVRPRDYHSKKKPNALPRVRDMESLIWGTRGVTLATYLHPDSTPSDVRAHQTRRGQSMKDRRGGRPRRKPGYKKKERIINIRKIRRMSADGMSVRQIARCLNKHPTQIQRWKQNLDG